MHTDHPHTTEPDDPQRRQQGDLNDTEGADAFETPETAQPAEREGAPERQDEEIITLDTPD